MQSCDKPLASAEHHETVFHYALSSRRSGGWNSMTPSEKVKIALSELTSEQPLGSPQDARAGAPRRVARGAWREGKLTNRLFNNI
jgi:hypothetical protein